MGLATIKMPQLGESVTEGTVEKWLKREGDLVERDEPLVEVVTDKVNAEIPCPHDCRLVKILVVEGETVSAGIEIAQVMLREETPSGPEAEFGASAQPAALAHLTTTVIGVSQPTEPHASPLSPAVRRLAQEHGIDPTGIPGTGESGRVTRDDVLASLATRPSSTDPAEELVPLSAMRRAIADHMSRSLAASPHAWMLQEVDMTDLVLQREADKDAFRARHGVPLTFLPFVIQALCGALKEFPDLNSSWTERGILRRRYYNIGIAIAIPDGLIVPVIKDADRLGLSELALKVAELIDRARSNRLAPDEVQGGTFTLNNTGPTGSVASQPIINQPQAAILTMEAITRRPVVIGDGIAIRHMMNLCLSLDHRIIDGTAAGGFLGHIRNHLETWAPARLAT